MGIPIILLPGIMGSRLYFENSGLFWDPDDKWRMIRWLPIWPRSDDDNRVALNAQQPGAVVEDQANVNADQMARGWSGVAWDYFGPMLNALDAAWGGSVYAIGYDWRQDMVALADYVVEKINGIMAQTGATKVAVVAHSMGGLVLRAALRQGAINPKIAAVINVCVPTSGAVVMYRRMFTGMQSQFDGSGIGDWAFRILLGDSRAGYLGNVSGLPGAVELVPGAYFPAGESGTPWNPMLPATPYMQLFGNSNSPPGVVAGNIGLSSEVVSDLNDRIADSNNFQTFIGNPADVLLNDVFLIYGTARTPLTIPLTDVQIAFSNGSAVPIQDISGDGTVPVASATSLQLSPGRMIPRNVEHSMACADATVISDVKGILLSYVEAGNALQPPEPWKPPPPPPD
jgi:pimeloyl-ACP methyl ester carboxylesterase